MSLDARRNADAFLGDLAARAHGAWVHAAHVGMMSAIGDIERGAILAGEKDRRNHGDIGQMCSAAIGIVEQSDVAGSQSQICEYSGDRHGHGAEVDGHVVAHGDEVASPPPLRRRPVCGDHGVGRENGGGVIAALLDVGREGGTTQCGSHLNSNGVEGVADDGNFGGVGLTARGHRRAPDVGVRTRFESASTAAVQPVGR